MFVTLTSDPVVFGGIRTQTAACGTKLFIPPELYLSSGLLKQ